MAELNETLEDVSVKKSSTEIQIDESIKEIYSSNKPLVTVAITLLIVAIFWGLSSTHTEGTSWGWKSILPTLSVLVIAIWSRRPFESMLAGSIAGLIMLNPENLISPLADNISKVMGNETIVWIVLVCGLMGGFIRILEISSCLDGFTEWLKTKIKSRRQSTIATVVLGAVVFIDDYLSCLAVSSSVKKLTDFYKVSREKVAYLIDSAAAPMCVIVPISTWAVFFAGLLEESHIADDGQGMSLYVSSIPFMMYAWVALIIAFLVAAGIIGDFGPMKKAEARAKQGHPIPEDFQGEELQSKSKAKRKLSMQVQLFNFFFPVVLLVASTVYYDIDLLKGVIITCAVTVLLYYVQGLLSLDQQMDALFEGFNTMLYPLSTVIGGFLLKEINDSLGMTQYIIDSVTPYLSQATYPAIVFVLLALIVFGTASSWGVFVIAIPIVIPIAQHLDVHMPLVIGALLSASSFGSHSCFFSDSSILAAQGSGCSPMSHAFTQFPYALLGAVIAVVAFLALGFAYA
ncbi:sodium:proton antiporter [Vibrio sp.]|uniref:Sodium:proton antiporter n=1 Tax=Vibrio viridaestus TaxID=2487322 RepID=A0A3N9TMU6_9VIBR|nr:Na+/H+ antiporter NhaC family protein [Vibrio viridaestus]MDC0612018.1 sodium:proton antiporter [Vibrio sp.]RQW64975.1 sodium:proton antiporter [Vibrio viridaestus]